MEENKQKDEAVQENEEAVEEAEASMEEDSTVENDEMNRGTEIEQELDEIKNRLLRTQADYDNFRRRTREEKEAAAKYRAQSIVEGLLPVIDNFERALSMEAAEEQNESLLQGMKMVYNQLIEALKNEGVEEVDAVGAEFDPHLHQAVMQVQEDDHEDNTVVEVLQKGYVLKDRVIRPAMVKVNSK
ncbi:nucleotide exchange factor GrpE [Pseudalkalibacillus berkeleyi]|uniref:Protein GrpE n=1 Tax=Pseudalkalibacillus berkeleyi TaxID=1069813 RepID=A0ABS9H1R9_9BACL|nr:nucleotide exchange factor GrpE [Pseudalkalibacillus berkeleyi]MCF6137981.1 nucleotide exchange factor GrpE [Pseudalkalibacillus berkeleyi]